jgi:hypothetical protein
MLKGKEEEEDQKKKRWLDTIENDIRVVGGCRKLDEWKLRTRVDDLK